jgi:hypothetical protein
MSVLIEVIACSRILEKWKENPTLTKQEIGVWSRWKEGGQNTGVPLSKKEVQRMKEFLRRVAPTEYARLFSGFPDQG